MRLSRETVLTPAGSSFKRLEIDQPLFDSHYHYHPEVELTWIVESEGQRVIGDSIQTFQKGDLVLIGSNVPHQYRNWKEGRARAKVVQFRREFVDPGLFDLPEFAGANRLLDDAARGLVFSSATAEAARLAIDSLFQSSLGYRQLLSLLELLALLSQDADRQPLASVTYAQPLKRKNIDRLQRVLNFIEEHWREPIALRDAAEVAALHPQSISRFFQQHLGMNFQQYLVRLRLARSARLLLETDRTVADIAFHCGFNNLSNFNRHFHLAYGRTPRSYRRRPQPEDRDTSP